MVDTLLQPGQGAAANRGGTGMRTVLLALGIAQAKARGFIHYDANTGRLTIADLEFFLALGVFLGHTGGKDSLGWRHSGLSYSAKRVAAPVPVRGAAVIPAVVPKTTLKADTATQVDGRKKGYTHRAIIYADGAGSSLAQRLRIAAGDVGAYPTPVTFDGTQHPSAITAATNVHGFRTAANSVVFVMWVFEVVQMSHCPDPQTFASYISKKNGMTKRFPAFLELSLIHI